MADGERFQEVQVHDLTFVVFLLSSSILNLALIIVYFSCTFRYSWISLHLKQRSWYFPGNPVVKTSPFKAESEDLILGRGAKMPHSQKCQ